VGKRNPEISGVSGKAPPHPDPLPEIEGTFKESLPKGEGRNSCFPSWFYREPCIENIRPLGKPFRIDTHVAVRRNLHVPRSTIPFPVDGKGMVG